MPHKYQHEIPSMGDQLRVAAMGLARDIETYLYDEDRAGHGQRDFLVWALARFDATFASTGNIPNTYLYWDPKTAERDESDERIHEGQTDPDKTYNPSAQAQFGIKYPHDHETSYDGPGDRERLGLDEAEEDWRVPYGTVAVHDPAMARLTSANAVPFKPKAKRAEEREDPDKRFEDPPPAAEDGD